MQNPFKRFLHTFGFSKVRSGDKIERPFIHGNFMGCSLGNRTKASLVGRLFMRTDNDTERDSPLLWSDQLQHQLMAIVILL